MILNEEFLNLYEELSELNESKVDTQKLIDFAGEDLANRFLAVKHRLKTPENDLYYWIKNKTVDELVTTVTELENNLSNSQRRKEIIKDGAELVCETDLWKVYHITTFEASQYYGRDTKWCITGVNDYGDTYWKQYTENGIQFYFLISKDKYDPRGYNSKFALAVYPSGKGEAYNQQDHLVHFQQIPGHTEINIPGLDVKYWYTGDGIEDASACCEECESVLSDEELISGWGADDRCYCTSCWKERFFTCEQCDEVYYLEELCTSVSGESLCPDCYNKLRRNY